MSQRKRQQKIPKHLHEYVLGTKEYSKHDMECSDDGDENITFIPPMGFTCSWFFKLFTFIRQLQAFSTLSASNTVIGLLDNEDPVETRKISGDRREIIGGVEVLSEKIYKEIIQSSGC